jgi:hypothetical protein
MEQREVTTFLVFEEQGSKLKLCLHQTIIKYFRSKYYMTVPCRGVVIAREVRFIQGKITFTVMSH